MEEILASIRRIIADDEAKPPTADKAPSPQAAGKPDNIRCRGAAAKPPVMKDIPPSANPAAPAVFARPAPIAPAAEPAPEPEVSNSQDDIDAMLAGLDEATSEAEIRPPLPDGEVFELTDEMAVPDAPPPAPALHRIEPDDDLEFTESAATRAMHRQSGFEPPPLESVAPPPPPSRRYCRARRCRRSNPPSIRWPIPCSATMRGRWKTWSRKCCGRC